MRHLSVLGLAVATMLTATGVARSAPPPNDACANATPKASSSAGTIQLTQ